MVKKVIQVPVDDELLKELDALCQRRRMPRSALIREACARYLRQTEIEELDRKYREGYEKTPEDSAIGMAQVTIAGEFLAKESW